MSAFNRFLQAAVLMIVLLSVCLKAFPQDNGTATDSPGADDYFLSRLNPGIGPAQRTESDAWEDAVYNQAVALYKQARYAQAASVYERACNRSAKACTNLGFMYAKGQGVKMSRSLAAEYYKRGCDNGNALGCTNLGIQYLLHDPPKNDSHAIQFFELGCRSGDSGGCRELSYMYRHGFGVLKDEARAFELYQQAVQLSHVHRIQFHLRDGLVLVSLTIRDESTILIVDTGSARTALTRKFLPSGWSLFPGATVSTILGSTQAYAVDVDWKLDGRNVRLPALIGDFNFPYGASGLLGADILGTFTSVRFDYESMVLILED
jgi:TPR repeat protein